MPERLVFKATAGGVGGARLGGGGGGGGNFGGGVCWGRSTVNAADWLWFKASGPSAKRLIRIMVAITNTEPRTIKTRPLNLADH